MKRRVSSSAIARSDCHCCGSSVAAASTGAETVSRSDAKYSSRPSGSGQRGDGPRGGGAQRLRRRSAHRRGSHSSACGDRRAARCWSRRARRGRPAAASAPPHRGGRSAGWLRTVSRRSSNRTGDSVSSRRTVHRLYASVYDALRRHVLNHPETGQSQAGGQRKRAPATADAPQFRVRAQACCWT